METAPLYTDVAEAPDGSRAFYVKATDGTRIRFALWNGGTRGLALVLPGRTECVEKFGRMAGNLLARGFSVAVIDWRGQGLADRPNNSTAIGDVADFADYQLDMDAVLAHPEIQAIDGKRVMFAHSMGGCIGLRTLMQRGDFSAAIFSAPMWGLYLPGANRFLAPLLARLGTALGLGKKTVLGQPKGFYLTREPFENNTLTSDQDHWRYMRDQIIKHPDLALGSPSFRWLKSALDEFTRFAASPMPALPTLAFVGSNESIVNADAIRQQIPHFPKGKLVEIDGSQHEIWMETPERQKQCWDAIDVFLKTAL